MKEKSKVKPRPLDGNVEIVEKDGKKYIDREISFKYNIEKRILIVIAFLVIILLGFFFLLIGHWFTIFFGTILLLIGLPSMLDILFFKQLIFSDKYVMKEWFIFGRKKIEFNNLTTGVAKKVWSGTIFFRDKKKKSILQFFMNFETFPIGNNGFKKIRKILINKKIIKGDENGWNY